MFTGELEDAILKTLAYSDIFEFPLRLEEVHRYLSLPASKRHVLDALTSTMREQVGLQDDYFFLVGREELVEIRKQREANSKSLFRIAMKYGRILGRLPFVRMVGLTGSLAVLNGSKDPDFDYMLVTVPGRLWTARAFVLLFNRAVKRFGHTICPNLIITETALEWRQHDLYSARELCQMIPITGMDVYESLLKANTWTNTFLPNVFMGPNDLQFEDQERRISRTVQGILEFPLRSGLGCRFEKWEMSRKIARFSKQEGFGEETVFTAEICQGNFHHHRAWTEKALQARISAVGEPALPEKRVEELV